jgi:hypothetical protein
MPRLASLAIAHATIRVLEQKLEKVKVDAQLSSQKLQQAHENKLLEMKGFYELLEEEKKRYEQQVHQQGVTIDQLSHHLKTLQLSKPQPASPESLRRKYQLPLVTWDVELPPASTSSTKPRALKPPPAHYLSPQRVQLPTPSQPATIAVAAQGVATPIKILSEESFDVSHLRNLGTSTAPTDSFTQDLNSISRISNFPAMIGDRSRNSLENTPVRSLQERLVAFLVCI